MYRAVDTLPAWRAFMYFTTMIFFLSWLVKNVFIAVITETFNEIRVQFQQMWGQRGSQLADIVDARAPIISGDDRGWKLVPTDATRHQYRTVMLFLPVLNSAAFHLLLMAAILANGLFTASMSFRHDGRPRSDFYQQHYYIEVIFVYYFWILIYWQEILNWPSPRWDSPSFLTWRPCSKYGVLASVTIMVVPFTSLSSSWSLEQHSTCFPNFIYLFWPTFKFVRVPAPSTQHHKLFWFLLNRFYGWLG